MAGGPGVVLFSLSRSRAGPPAPAPAEAPGAPGKAKKGAKKPVKAPTPIEEEGDFELVDVDGGFYMVNKADQKAYRADLNKDGD